MCVDTAPADQGTSTFDFEVTSSGLDSSQDRARTLWMYVVAGVFFVLLIIFAWKTEFGWIGFLAGVMLLMPGIDLMINGFGMNDILMTRGIATVIIAIAAITMIVFSYEALSSDSTRHKEEDGGEEAEDDHDYFKSA